MNSLVQGRPTLKNALLQQTSTSNLRPPHVFSAQIIATMMPQIQLKWVFRKSTLLNPPVPISRAMKRLNQKLK